MPEITGDETEFKGHYGRARLIPLPDVPESAETVCSWLLTAPHAHPLWAQYLLGMVRLRDGIPGFKPPARQFIGATHELFVFALNPEHGPYTVEKMQAYGSGGGSIPCLTPVNVVHQVEGTDEEARLLASFAAVGVVHGMLWPETGDAPRRIREDWLVSMVKSLAHIRGEEHAP